MTKETVLTRKRCTEWTRKYINVYVVEETDRINVTMGVVRDKGKERNKKRYCELVGNWFYDVQNTRKNNEQIIKIHNTPVLKNKTKQGTT